MLDPYVGWRMRRLAYDEKQIPLTRTFSASITSTLICDCAGGSLRIFLNLSIVSRLHLQRWDTSWRNFAAGSCSSSRTPDGAVIRKNA